MGSVDHPFEYPLEDWADLHARIRRVSGSQEDILESIGLKKRVSESLLCDMPEDRRDLFASRATAVFEARNVIKYLKSRHDEARERSDEGAMEQWKDLLRKTYHMQFLPALAMLTAPEPNGFFKALFHSSRQDAEDYAHSIRTEVHRGYMHGTGLDL